MQAQQGSALRTRGADGIHDSFSHKGDRNGGGIVREKGWTVNAGGSCKNAVNPWPGAITICPADPMPFGISAKQWPLTSAPASGKEAILMIDKLPSGPVPVYEPVGPMAGGDIQEDGR